MSRKYSKVTAYQKGTRIKYKASDAPREKNYVDEEGNQLILKRGTEKVAHFAYLPNSNYPKDNFNYDPISDWHYHWQVDNFPAENIEVGFWGENRVLHRADVVVGKEVYELQHSIIKATSIKKRNEFYFKEKDKWFL